MKIKNCFQYYLDGKSSRYPLKTYKSKKMIHLRSLIAGSFYLLITNDYIDIDQLVSPKYNYSISGEMEGVLFDPKTKLIYCFDCYEEDKYIDDQCWPYDKSQEYYDSLGLETLTLVKKNLIGSTQLSFDNFIELINDWHQLNLQKVPFVLLYQDEQDWIACKGFETQEAMEAFVKQHSDEQL